MTCSFNEQELLGILYFKLIFTKNNSSFTKWTQYYSKLILKHQIIEYE